MIIYTYSQEPDPGEDRWTETGIGNLFFAEPEEVRRAVLDLRTEVISDDEDTAWRPVRIERIELPAFTQENVLTLLNEGIAPLINRYEILEIID